MYKMKKRIANGEVFNTKYYFLNSQHIVVFIIFVLNNNYSFQL